MLPVVKWRCVVQKQYNSLRLFKNPVLESFSHVHPIVPLVLWAPISAYSMYQALTVDRLSNGTFFLVGLIALFVWTLTEYTLHRFVFHFNGRSQLTKGFVYLFHGLHHDDPQDPTRLVMPPVPAVLIMSIIWLIFKTIIPSLYICAFMAFFIIGYLRYDYIHYATHHFKMTSKLGRYLRKFHLQHHYQHEKSKYGVSNPLWDFVFNTVSGPKEDEDLYEWKPRW